MIEQVKAYKVGESTFQTIEEAQEAALVLISPDTSTATSWPTVAEWIVEHKDAIVAILLNKPEPKPRKPRKDKGTKRGAKQAAIGETMS